MKILYFYQYFSTPKGSWGTRVYEFAREWVKEGHEVTVVSAVYTKSDLQPKKLLETQYFNGIKVLIVNVSINNKQSVLKRIISFVTYAWFACFYAITQRADVVIASSGPITVGIPGLVAKWLGRKKLVMEVRDLWPEGAVSLGVIKNKLIIKLAYSLEKVLYKNSKLIVTLSPGMARYVQDNYRHPNVISVTNSANIKLFSEKQDNSLENYGLAGKQYAIYTGNIGQVNNSTLLYETAVRLKELGRDDITILMVGDGQQKEQLQRLKEDNDLKNFLIFDLMPKTELVFLVQNAITSLVPLNNTPVLSTSSPNKLFESLAAGVPVIQTTFGWMQDYLNEHNIGFTSHPDKPEDLADKIIELCDNKDLRTVMGKNARNIATRDFDHRKLSMKMLDAILKIR